MADPAGLMASSLTTRLDGKNKAGKLTGNDISYQPTECASAGKHTVLVSMHEQLAACARATHGASRWAPSRSSAP